MADDRVLEQARAVWRSAMERDDAFAAVARERRLSRGVGSRADGTSPAPQAPPERGRNLGFPSAPLAIPWQAIALGALIAVGGWAVRGPAKGVAASGAADTDAVARSVAGTASVSPEAPPSPAADAQPPALVARAPCFGCQRAGSEASGTAAGERLVPGERVSVPSGSTLILCFGIGAGASNELAVSGPATVVVTSNGTVSVEPAEPAVAPIGRTSEGSGRHETIATAQEPEHRPEAPAADSSAPDWEAQWRAAQAALDAGHRGEAERRLRSLLALSSVPAAPRERASFLLAELELARGAPGGDARSRLEALQGSADDALAADAVFLEARAIGSPRERVALFARYVAADPPSPYLETAIVDEAVALLEAGDADAARARVAELRAAGPVPELVAGALARLERALEAR
jgi:hypothetical protein